MQPSIRYVLVCYGPNPGYVHGAKYQIARAFHDQFMSEYAAITVVTDQVSAFLGYPVTCVELTAQMKTDWSFGNRYHFGIKNRALAHVISQSEEDIFLQLDTDTYWRKSPKALAGNVYPSSIVLKFEEGPVIGSQNRSIARFEEGLAGRDMRYGQSIYRLDKYARMWNSGLIGIHRSDAGILDEAYQLMEVIFPDVQAHTVEQFVLGEVCRLKALKLSPARHYLGDWSSIGKKDYFTPELAQFFDHFGEHDFSTHVHQVASLRPRRPINVFLQQKLQRLWNKIR